MQATINYSALATAKPKPVPVPGRYRLTMGELLRRAAAAVDRKQVKLITGTFTPVKKGQPLTRRDRALMLLLVGGLGLAVWLFARPAPVSAHANYYQSLALSTRLEATAPRPYTESVLRALGSDWRPATLFASVHPTFWHNGAAEHPNAITRRIETGLARLAGHGTVLGATTFSPAPAMDTETINGTVMPACRVDGQLELADGVVVRFEARLVQDERTKHWGIINLSLPPFLP